jgi:hypothetical protein
MANPESPEPIQAPALTPLPSVEELPTVEEGYDRARVHEAFESYRRHVTQLQVQLRVLQTAARSGDAEPSGHAVRMDALHLIRAAAELADTIERDAQQASVAQVRKAEEEISRRQRGLQERAAEIERFRQESERERAETLNQAKNEARELIANANRDATQELREAEARAARLIEQARHQATELTNAARAEVEQTLEWARAQASAVMSRAQEAAEDLLSAAGLGEEAIGRVVDKIVSAAEAVTASARGSNAPPVPRGASTERTATPTEPHSVPETRRPSRGDGGDAS